MSKEYEEWLSGKILTYCEEFECAQAFEAGQQSQQAKIDELQSRVDELEKHLAIVLDEYYIEGCFSTKICNDAEKALNKNDRLNDSWYVKHVKPYSE